MIIKRITIIPIRVRSAALFAFHRERPGYRGSGRYSQTFSFGLGLGVRVRHYSHGSSFFWTPQGLTRITSAFTSCGGRSPRQKACWFLPTISAAIRPGNHVRVSAGWRLHLCPRGRGRGRRARTGHEEAGAEGGRSHVRGHHHVGQRKQLVRRVDGLTITRHTRHTRRSRCCCQRCS